MPKLVLRQQVQKIRSQSLLRMLNVKGINWKILYATLILTLFYWFLLRPNRPITSLIGDAHIYFVGNPGAVASIVVLFSGIIPRLFRQSSRIEAASSIIGIIVATILGLFVCIASSLSLMGPF